MVALHTMSPPKAGDERLAWVEIHRHLRFVAGAMLLEALGAAAGAVVINHRATAGPHATDLSRKLARPAVAALGYGTLVFAALCCNLFITYPSPTTFPPSATLKRVQVGRIILLFFGVGYVYRGVEVLKASHWLEYSAAAAAKSASAAGRHGGAEANVGGGVVEAATKGAMDARDVVLSDEYAWRDGGFVAGVMAVAGISGILLSWFSGWHLRRLKDNMKRTRSMKGKLR